MFGPEMRSTRVEEAVCGSGDRPVAVYHDTELSRLTNRAPPRDDRSDPESDPGRSRAAILIGRSPIPADTFTSWTLRGARIFPRGPGIATAPAHPARRGWFGNPEVRTMKPLRTRQ